MGAIVVIGNFDGVHRGHRALLTNAAHMAEARGLECVVLTFVPHPLAVLGRIAPPVLTSPRRKRALVDEIGHAIAGGGVALRFVEHPFDRAFAAQSPRAFAEWLVRAFDAKVVTVGQNFRFGHGREGTFDTLVALGRELGFEARAEPLVADERGTISSTRVRGAIAAAQLAEAAALLGRPHSFSGRVERGKQLGRTIGFPTANIGDPREMIPPFGVYAALVDRVAEDSSDHAAEVDHPLGRGAMSIGVNPTTDATASTKIEVFVFDRWESGRWERGFSGDLYGAKLRVHAIERLRGEEKFDSLDALVAQIGADVDDARAILDRR
ncbi:MAG: riboflavin biosynthesis protein RibF [Polyangiaceae bacterium]